MNSSHVSDGQRDNLLSSVSSAGTVLVLGVVINSINGSLIHTFRKHQVFYLNPRYVLFLHLVVNDMLQLSSSVLLVLLGTSVERLSAAVCCVLLLFAIFTTFNTPLNLAVMAVERYIAVCLPLRHAQLCTVRRTCVLIGCVWALSVSSALTDLVLAVATEPARFAPGSSLYCEDRNVFRHPASRKKKEVTFTFYLVCVWLTLAYTYLRIYGAARAAKAGRASGGGGDAAKARNTVLLHGFQLLLCMLTYVSHAVIRALVSALPGRENAVVFACYVVIHVLPRFVSPVVYGLRDDTFKRHFRSDVLCGSARADPRPAGNHRGKAR